MKIVVNTGVLLHDNFQNYHGFLNEVLEIIVNRNSEHEFIILARDADAKKFLTFSNVTKVTRRYNFHHPLLVRVWYDFKLPAILKKFQADLFVSFDGLCSLTARLPQCVLVNDLPSIGHSPRRGRPRLLSYEHFMRRALQKASALVCWSDFKKKDLMLRYAVHEKKINVVYPAAKETFQPLNGLVKEEVRRNYCNEKNYFVCAEAFLNRNGLLNLLKAFSVFKKRQKSNWKLMLMGNPQPYGKKLLEELRFYKYRDDVVVVTNETQHDAPRLIGSAYALICAVHSDKSAFPILQALNCQVPVIAADTPPGREIAGDAALYFDPSDYENIADQMMMMYKDESLRNRLIDKGKLNGAKYSLDKSANLLWECICRTPADCKPLA